MAEHDEMDELNRLRAEGMLTETEHHQAREQLAQRAGDPADGDPADDDPADDDPADDDPPGPSTGRRPRLPLWAMIAWPVALAAAGVGLIVWALTSGGSGSGGNPVNGLIAVVDHQAVAPDEAVPLDTHFGQDGYAVGKACHTLSGYPDIVGGAQVVITDAAGKALAHTKLRSGVFDVSADCVFGFETSVKQSDTYRIKVGQRDPIDVPPGTIAHPQLSLG